MTAFDDDDDYVPPPHPRDLIPERIIQDLWGIGFTIVPRARDPFDAAGLAPAGMVYEWNAYEGGTGNPKRVPASRHPGIFAPYGYMGDIEVHGLWLMERPKAEVDAFHADAHAKARQNVDNWFQRQAESGFTGGVTILSEGSGGRSAEVSEIGDDGPARTKIPSDMFDHLPDLMRERDRLVAAYQLIPMATQPLDLRDKCLKQAIENIRAKLAAEGANHDQGTEHGQPVEGDAGKIGSGGLG